MSETAVTEPSIVISDADILRYEADGAMCLRGVISLAWIERLRAATAALEAEGLMDMSKNGKPGKFHGTLNAWEQNAEFKAFAMEGPSKQIAKALMRSHAVRLFADQLFIKEPGTATATPWHQDQPYWPVVGDHVCSVWVTMDPVTIATSGLEYVRGSHRWGRRFDPEDFGEMSLAFMHDAANEKIPDIDGQRDQYQFLSWDMQPGDCLVHHSMAVHGAGGNTSSASRRRAISTRWLGDQAYFRPFLMYTTETTGLQPGAPMHSPMFPAVAA